MRPTMNLQIANTLSAVPEVESIYVLPGACAADVQVLTIVDKEDDQVYALIYEKELQLARELPGVQFDFSVRARQGRPVEHIVGQNHPAWERARRNGHPD